MKTKTLLGFFLLSLMTFCMGSVFTYKGENDVEKQHTFFNFSPYLGTQSLTRERGPITTAWLEDVSDSPYLEDVLPADRTVVYWVDTMIFNLSAEDL